jgi:formate-dependent nitrite reductase membrane component NrfD
LEPLLTALEGSWLGETMRSSGVWAYGVVNLVHILSIATLFGSVLMLDLRLLGAWRRVPLTSVEELTVPLSIAGFFVAVASGMFLISTNATEYIGNPFLPIKFLAITLGVLNAALAPFLPAWRLRETPDGEARVRVPLATLGGVSLACWLTALTAGRMLGYW